MNKKIIPMIGIAAIFGSISIFAANQWLNSRADTLAAEAEAARRDMMQTSAAPAAAFGTIVVARATLGFGARLAEAELEEIPWAKGELPKGAFAKVSEIEAAGPRVVLDAIQPNEPVLLSKLSGPNGRAALSNKIEPGMQAITIKSDAVTGVGGFLTPGDHVDVFFTRSAEQTADDGPVTVSNKSETVTDVIVRSARVLSVGLSADEAVSAPAVVDNVTIEVNPAAARQIAVAQSAGSITLVLNAAGETAPSADAGDAASGRPMAEVRVTRGGEREIYKVPAAALR